MRIYGDISLLENTRINIHWVAGNKCQVVERGHNGTASVDYVITAEDRPQGLKLKKLKLCASAMIKFTVAASV